MLYYNQHPANPVFKIETSIMINNLHLKLMIPFNSPLLPININQPKK